MHPIQEKLMALLRDQGSIPLKYREIGRRIGEEYPQTVKHHIEALIKKGLLSEQNGFLKLIRSDVSSSSFLNLPFYGLANCGAATILAEDKADGYIRISRNALPRKTVEDFYILRAFGNSMNRAQVGQQKRNIEDGDFVIVDAKVREPQDGQYVVSILDDYANIKKFRSNPASGEVQLIAESSDEYLPIILHESDNFSVMGTVVDVVKSTR